MNIKNLLIASLIGAGAASILSLCPGVSCLACLPFCGPLLAVWYYKRQTGTLTMSESISVGILTGMFVTVFFFFLIMFEMVLVPGVFIPPNTDGLPGMPPLVSSLFLALGYTVMSFIVNVFFGLLAGLAGGAAFQDKPTSPAPPVA